MSKVHGQEIICGLEGKTELHILQGPEHLAKEEVKRILVECGVV